MPRSDRKNEIYLCREYDAPVAVVWDAWTDPEQAAQWWGPRGFTLTNHSKDLRPGGIWHYTMHGPDGVDYENKALYHEVVEFKKLVYDHGGNDERAPLFRVTVLFSEQAGKTTMEMTMALPSAEEAESTRKFIKKAGGNATWDRLAEYLDQQRAGRSSFVINRSFEAPVEVVFEMWSHPRHFSKWLPPIGFEMEILQGEIRAGANIFYRMSNRSDVTMYGRIEYKEIVGSCRLAYTQQFCDERGNLTRPPHISVWPATMLSTVRFSSEGPDATRVTVHWEPVGEVTASEIEAFLDMRPSMTQGWTGSFDKLESYLGASGQGEKPPMVAALGDVP